MEEEEVEADAKEKDGGKEEEWFDTGINNAAGRRSCKIVRSIILRGADSALSSRNDSILFKMACFLMTLRFSGDGSGRGIKK